MGESGSGNTFVTRVLAISYKVRIIDTFCGESTVNSRAEGYSVHFRNASAQLMVSVTDIVL